MLSSSSAAVLPSRSLAPFRSPVPGSRLSAVSSSSRPLPPPRRHCVTAAGPISKRGPVVARSSFPVAKSLLEMQGAAVAELDPEMERFVEAANKMADASGEVLRKYFRKSFQILDKEDLSPVTIADREAEEAMVSIILESFPDHAIFGEENGWRCKEKTADYVWVLDPIDGTKSFITGKPLFGTLIALLRQGQPILGIIDQPILRERWLGVTGRRTTMNGQEVSTRPCSKLSQAYLYTTSPHLFEGDAEKAFSVVRDKVKVPLYGCDCYAYALLASGFVDLVIESGLKPYDFLSLVPVIEGAGGSITDWSGNRLCWDASPESRPASFNVVAAGDPRVHKLVLDELKWK